jgi:hypothetical protein
MMNVFEQEVLLDLEKFCLDGSKQYFSVFCFLAFSAFDDSASLS